MKKHYKPRVVMSIHGYLSTGSWQTKLTSSAESLGLISCEFHYGFTLRFDRFKINRLVEKFKNWYFQVCTELKGTLNVEEPFHRPSIVAHSLGSWIIAKAIEKYPEIKFDKIFLHGAIIPNDYNWYKLILNDQVSKIVCEKSTKDAVVKWSYFLTGSWYPCSRYEFTQKSSYIKYEDVTLFGHSDFQYSERFKNQMNKHLYDEPTQLKVIQGGDLNSRQLRKYFKETLKIDSEAYGSEYIDNNPVSLDRAFEWAAIEKNIWSFIVNSYTDKVIGYVNILGVNEETHAKYLVGAVAENEIKSGDLCSFDTGSTLNLIVMSIALDKTTLKQNGSLLNSRQGELLLAVLSQKVLSVTKGGSTYGSVSAIAWTDVGENIAKSFGLIKTKSGYRGLPIYLLSKDDLKALKNKTMRPLCQWWISQMIMN